MPSCGALEHIQRAREKCDCLWNRRFGFSAISLRIYLLLWRLSGFSKSLLLFSLVLVVNFDITNLISIIEENLDGNSFGTICLLNEIISTHS